MANSLTGSRITRVRAKRSGSHRRILVLSSPFSSVAHPTHGVFVKERVRAVADLPGYEVRVVSPVPYFPPIRWFKRWYMWSQFPREEVFAGLPIARPRYFLPPKVGGYFESTLMYRAVRREVARIRAQFDFDLIDAHWVYPTGVVAVRLGQQYGKPVIVTGRGADMCCLPRLPIVGEAIRYALRNATQCVGVSREIAEAMVAHGADADRVSVVPNGVDCDKFRPLPKDEARRKLGLPPTASIVLSVGDFFENKGFHLLVDAVATLRRERPDVFLVIVGGPPQHGTDYSREIERRVAANHAESYVRLVGRRPHDELVWWYSAADVFALLSAREGSPNVLMEALACGVPAVATPVGGIPDVLEDSRCGILVAERSGEAAAVGLADALSRMWNRDRIRQAMEARSWRRTAKDVERVFDRTVESYQAESCY